MSEPIKPEPTDLRDLTDEQVRDRLLEFRKQVAAHMDELECRKSGGHDDS